MNEHGSMNGHGMSGPMAIYLMVGEIHSNVRHLTIKVDEVHSEVKTLKRRVGILERLRLRFRIPWKEMGGFLIGISALLAALAHRWDTVSQIARAWK
jgi:hypothetical protein